VLARLAGREDVRAESSKYEAIALALVNTEKAKVGQILTMYPVESSPLHFSRFFETIYREYDQRFVYAAPKLKRVTTRTVWDPGSPIMSDARIAEYLPRIGQPEPIESPDDPDDEDE